MSYPIRTGVKESDTGLAPPNLWVRRASELADPQDIAADKQRMGEEGPLQVARCTKIIKAPTPTEADIAARAASAAAHGGVAPPPNADEQDKCVIRLKSN